LLVRGNDGSREGGEERAVAEPIDVGVDGVVLIPLTAHSDERGSFTEVYRRKWVAGMREGVQANLSLSRPGVLRGLHFHRKQADYWCVLTGTAFVGLYDLRAGSPTEGKRAEVRIEAGARRHALYIPKGVAHGYYAETDVLMEYLVDEYYTGADEFGVAWDDPDVGIGWPSTRPILSERDRSNPGLADVVRDPPRYER
jgi:dTDP-4-dehydrorhamnose 3,5-epimerase